MDMRDGPEDAREQVEVECLDLEVLETRHP